MKVTLIPSSVSAGEQAHSHFLTSYLINDTLAVDVGSLALFQSPREQARIKHVLISHTHIDHIATLPILLENIFRAADEPVTVHGSAAVLDCLQRDLFNGRVWPDFIALSRGDQVFLRLAELEAGRPVHLEGLRITPVAVNHVVPTLGFIIEDKGSAVVIASDTGPTEELWERANQTSHLKAVFLEACFPDALAGLAEVSKHLTPATFAAEVRKLKKRKQRPAIVAVHIKPRYRDQVVSELQALDVPGLTIPRYGTPYQY